MGFGLIIGRTTSATITIFLSFILSYVMLIGLALFQADFLRSLQNIAKNVEAFLLQPQIPAELAVWMDQLIDEGTLLLLFFTVIARILIAIVASSMSAAVNPKRR